MSATVTLVLHALEARSHITDIKLLELGYLGLWKVAFDSFSHDCIIDWLVSVINFIDIWVYSVLAIFQILTSLNQFIMAPAELLLYLLTFTEQMIGIVLFPLGVESLDLFMWKLISFLYVLFEVLSHLLVDLSLKISSYPLFPILCFFDLSSNSVLFKVWS